MTSGEGTSDRAASWDEISELGSFLKLQIGQDAASATALQDVDSSDADGLQKVHDDALAAHLDANQRVLRVIELCAPPASTYRPDEPEHGQPDDSAQRQTNFAELQRMAHQYQSNEGWREEWKPE